MGHCALETGGFFYFLTNALPLDLEAASLEPGLAGGHNVALWALGAPPTCSPRRFSNWRVGSRKVKT